MESHRAALWMIFFMVATCATADLSKDREECETQLVGLAPCLPYASGSDKAPTLDCCTGLKQVLGKSKKCLCVLVKDRDDPKLGLKINATLALGLPSKCNATANASECPALLHLAPNSPEAEVFEQYANSTTSGEKGNAGSSSKTNWWMGVKIAVGVVILTSIPGV